MRKLLTLALLILFLSGCGYRIYTKSDLPFKDIYLRKVENLTVEPGLEDRVRKIAYQRLIENGFKITTQAERILDVEIKNYRLITLSEISLNTFEYQISIELKANLYDERGKLIREFSPQSPFSVTFRTPRDLKRLLIEKNNAIDNLINNLCEEMVRKIIFE